MTQHPDFSLNHFTISFPLVLSFDRRVHFYTNWRHLLPAMAMAVTGIYFIAWDQNLTQNGVWGVNPYYLVGIFLGDLPLEEILFFVTVPYACVIIYECLNTYVNKELLQPTAPPTYTWFLIGANSAAAVFFWGHWYTMLTCTLLPIMLLLYVNRFRYQKLGRFYLAYFVYLVPFLVINGLLKAMPVDWYNNAHNVGLRIGTIPEEDFMYAMLMLLMTIFFYENLKQKAAVRTNNTTPTLV